MPRRCSISLALIAATLLSTFGADVALDEQVDRWSVEERGCNDNLKFIYDALQAYRVEHNGKWPEQLWDLAPDLIRDERILVCPSVQLRGGLRVWRGSVRDPGFDPHTSYTYEFTQTFISWQVWRGLPKKTHREVKEQQVVKLGDYGGYVPIVRCPDHGGSFLNLGVGGRVYKSEMEWESCFTNVVALDDLWLQARLFANRRSAREVTAKDFPARDPQAPLGSIDLTQHYNALLDDDWQGFPENNLASMPSGLQQFRGVFFDVRGIVQLDGLEATVRFPQSHQGIPVHQKFRRIHFLHGATWLMYADRPIGAYVLCFADGQREELPIVNGQELADWWSIFPQPADLSNGKIAWFGRNKAAEAYGQTIRIYQSAWVNPRPSVELASIDFVSKVELAAPFLVAITLEP